MAEEVISPRLKQLREAIKMGDGAALDAFWRQLATEGTPHPLNVKTFIEPKDEERLDHAEDDIESVVMLPDAPAQTWTTPRDGIAKGTVARHLFYSQLLANERRVWVYTPPQYKAFGDSYGLLIILDGRFFHSAIQVPVILDNLLADGEIRPFVAVMVDNPGATWRESMTIREKELSCHPPFAAFLAREMIPWLRQTYHLTSDSRQTIVAGGSAGGLAAAFTAWQHPHTFGNVIALSGSFWWRPGGETEWEWLTRQLPSDHWLLCGFTWKWVSWKAPLRPAVSPVNCWQIAIYAPSCRQKGMNCIMTSKYTGMIR